MKTSAKTLKMERKGESEEQRVRVREQRDTERGDVKGTTPNKSKSQAIYNKIRKLISFLMKKSS